MVILLLRALHIFHAYIHIKFTALKIVPAVCRTIHSILYSHIVSLSLSFFHRGQNPALLYIENSRGERSKRDYKEIKFHAMKFNSSSFSPAMQIHFTFTALASPGARASKFHGISRGNSLLLARSRSHVLFLKTWEARARLYELSLSLTSSSSFSPSLKKRRKGRKEKNNGLDFII